MAIAFLTNGLGVFGTRILAGWSWADQYKFQYLAFWYGAGCLLALLLFLRSGLKVRWKELVIGAVASVGGGQLSLLTALEKGVPGHIAFPMANGGEVFLVALVGILSFGERVHHHGVAGPGVSLRARIPGGSLRAARFEIIIHKPAFDVYAAIN